MKLRSVAAAVALLVGAQVAQAGLLSTFTGVGAVGTSKAVDWVNSLNSGSQRLEDLETQFVNDAPTPGDPLQLKFMLNPADLSPKTANLTGGVISDTAVATGGRHGFGNTGLYLEGTPSFDIIFDEAVAAFAFWGSDIGDFGRGAENTSSLGEVLSVTLHYVDPSDDRTFKLTGDAANGNDLFWGFSDSRLGKLVKSVTFANISPNGNTDGQGFDNFMIGAVTQDDNNGGTAPEPGSLALAGLALLAAKRIARRR